MDYWGENPVYRVATRAGSVLRVDFSGVNNGYFPYVRTCILVDLSKPIVPGVIVDKNGEPHWVIFDYEQPLELCFRCGCMDHCFFECACWNVHEEGGSTTSSNQVPLEKIIEAISSCSS